MGTNVKFFDVNRIDDNSTFTFTSMNENLASYLYDNDDKTRLLSSGSDDLTDEVLEIEFSSSYDIDRLFIGNSNIKSGKVEYWNGSSWVSVWTITNNASSSLYKEITSVSTTKVKLTMSTTQTANDEKYLYQFRAMEEIGEVETNPSKILPMFKDKASNHTTSSGGNVNVLFGVKYRGIYDFTDAGVNDMTLFKLLKDRATAFYVYNSGGSTSYNQYGFRVDDMYLVNYVNDFYPKLKADLLGIGTTIQIQLYEV